MLVTSDGRNPCLKVFSAKRLLCLNVGTFPVPILNHYLKTEWHSDVDPIAQMGIETFRRSQESP